MIDLTGRIVLLTGAAGGIGSATARTLVRAGATVVIHDVRPDERSRLAVARGRSRSVREVFHRSGLAL